MGDAYAEAQRLRDVHALYCVPARVEGEGASKRVLPLGEWSVYLNGKDPDDAFADLWDQNTDAPALALMCGRRFGVIALDADTPEAEAYVLDRKVPRTPAWRSARGPHWLFRPGDRELTSTSGLVPGLDLLAESKLALIPPTPGRTWLPAASVDDAPIALLPDWLVTQAKVKRPRVAVVPGHELPPGEAHDRMVSILGRLGRVLPADELEAVAARLNEGRLPTEELTKIVEHVLEKEGDAGRYFDRKEGFLPAILATEIAEAYGIRRGVGGHLYHYRDGVHRFDGRERVEQVCRRVLGERFKPRHAREVVDVLRAGHQEIPDEPNPDLLNVANGMLDWRTADLLPHGPEHLSIIQLPVAWNSHATCPAIETFLSEVLPADAQRFTREAIGYTAVAEAFLRQAFMLLGSGSNGKSTFLSVLRRLLGRRNVSAVPLQAFGESRFAAAEVHGKLANVCGDLDSRALRRSDLFKTITGGTDAVMAERKYEHPFSFVPYATLLFSANEAPASSDQSDAYFDRWVILPFGRRFEGADVDPHLLDKLTTREELEGLLVQAVSGLMDLAERGAFRPAGVRAGRDRGVPQARSTRSRRSSTRRARSGLPTARPGRRCTRAIGTGASATGGCRSPSRHSPQGSGNCCTVVPKRAGPTGPASGRDCGSVPSATSATAATPVSSYPPRACEGDGKGSVAVAVVAARHEVAVFPHRLSRVQSPGTAKKFCWVGCQGGVVRDD